jgi:staphyloferrin B biosynthesis citrate synthase
MTRRMPERIDMTEQTGFRERLRAGQPLMGTFVKSPGVHGVEILGELGLDFIVIDAEHAPWDRAAVDHALLAARAHGLAALVRVQGVGDILDALDCGATGVMVPHVSTPETAAAVAAVCRYKGGSRGFSNSPRAGHYGKLGLAAHVQASDAQTTVIAMLEDPGALNHADAIAAIEGIDAFFLGRGDLTVALGESSPDADAVRQAVALFVQAVRTAGKPLCAFVGQVTEVAPLRALGITSFIVASDQSWLRQAASAQLQQFRSLTP